MANIHLDCKEETPCGGRVRYDVDKNDFISYSTFWNNDPGHGICHNCTWCLICMDWQEWKARQPEVKHITVEIESPDYLS